MIVVHGDYRISSKDYSTLKLHKKDGQQPVRLVCKYSGAANSGVTSCNADCPLLLTAERIGEYTWERGVLPHNTIAVAMCGCDPVVFAGPRN